MDTQTAIDIVDAYGPYRTGWPIDHRAALDSLAANDKAFAAYLDESKQIEDQFSVWQEAADGVDVDEDGATGGGEADQSDGDGSTPINLDPSKILDMDNMLSAFIEQGLAGRSAYSVFTKDYDKMVEIPTTLEIEDRGTRTRRTVTANLDTITRETAALVGPLQKEMMRLVAARTQAIRLPGQRKGRLHGPALHRILAGDDRCFTKRQEAPALDTAVTLLIDCSGSMLSNASATGVARYEHATSPFVLAVRSAFALATVLTRIGVPCEVLGYTTRSDPECEKHSYLEEVRKANDISPITRADPIGFPVFKEFHEPFNLEVQRRFAIAHDVTQAVAKGGTIEGCAVEHAARRLLKQKEKRKILMVMSDGRPQAGNYSAGVKSASGLVSHGYVEHARQMAQEVTKAGIDLVGLGIMYDGLRAYYPNAVLINKAADMPKLVLGALKKFILK